jgi:serine/threonine protein phosphatase PrpC
MYIMIIHKCNIIGRRNENQDSDNTINLLNEKNNINNNITLIGIYDGHGIHGKSVSAFLEENIPQIYLNKKIKIPISTKKHTDIFNTLQRKIKENPKAFNSGSTCLLGIIYKQRNSLILNIINLGDSRAIVITKKGKCKQITIDHKPNDKLEKKRIRDLGGTIQIDKEGTERICGMSVSKAFGDAENNYISQQPDVYRIKLDNISFIIFGCDGLFDELTNENISSYVLQNQHSNNIADDLCKLAYNAGSCDNISCIVVKI